MSIETRSFATTTRILSRSQKTDSYIMDVVLYTLLQVLRIKGKIVNLNFFRKFRKNIGALYVKDQITI